MALFYLLFSIESRPHCANKNIQLKTENKIIHLNFEIVVFELASQIIYILCFTLL